MMKSKITLVEMLAISAAVWVITAGQGLLRGADGVRAVAFKTESFDRDPGWEAQNNHLAPAKAEVVSQDFGYSAKTNFAAKEKGEIGGTVWRAAHPAWYADIISPKTLDDPLHASGTFAITKPGSGGVVFGWFNSHQIEGTSRPVQSLGLQIGTGKGGGVVHVRLHTAENQSCGTLIPPKGEKKEHGTFRNDGTRYMWKLDYDPQGSDGKGRITFSIRSNLDKPEAFEDQVFAVDLPDGYRKQGTVFDRFGMMNLTKPGGQTEVYFGDLHFDGQSPDLRTAPGWDAVENRATNAKGASGANDFGFSKTQHAGGEPGEIGGAIWRTGKLWAGYADKVGALTMGDRLEAGGKVCLEVGAPDSGMYLGWFRSGTGTMAPDQAGNFVGIKVAGPSRVGHELSPAYTTANGTAHTGGKGPVLVPGRTYDWGLIYDPLANAAQGSIRVTLGDQSIIFNLKKGDEAQGGQFDRFGLFSLHNDGGHAQIKIWFDDLKYTVARP